MQVSEVLVKCEEEEPKQDKGEVALCFPGEEIVQEQGYMPGYGTEGTQGAIRASVLGRVVRVNKLVCVNTVKPQRYRGEVGDVVVGTVTEVQQKRFLVDVKSATQAVLLLSSVNLPGGVLR